MTGVVLFEVDTPLGCRVRCTRTYWDFIVREKHPCCADAKTTWRAPWPSPSRSGGAGSSAGRPGEPARPARVAPLPPRNPARRHLRRRGPDPPAGPAPPRPSDGPGDHRRSERGRRNRDRERAPEPSGASRPAAAPRGPPRAPEAPSRCFPKRAGGPAGRSPTSDGCSCFDGARVTPLPASRGIVEASQRRRSCPSVGKGDFADYVIREHGLAVGCTHPAGSAGVRRPRRGDRAAR
jgi:hypothetical protein